MYPGLCNGDLVIARPCPAAELQPGDIVLALHPSHPQLLIKRLDHRKGKGWWLLGDNPQASTDSRHFGAVTDERVLAVVTAVAPAGYRRLRQS